MTRTKAREIAYSVIFSNNFNPVDSVKQAILDALDGQPIKEDELNFVESLISGVIKNKEVLQDIIERNLVDYSIDRVMLTDLTALMLAGFELKYTNTPTKVILNEAINIVKKYSSDKSSAFVNSVLNKVSKEIRNE